MNADFVPLDYKNIPNDIFIGYFKVMRRHPSRDDWWDVSFDSYRDRIEVLNDLRYAHFKYRRLS